MTPESQAEIDMYVESIARILYQEVKNTSPDKLTSLVGIEISIRDQIRQQVGPKVANFFLRESTGTTTGRSRSLQSCIGTLTITSSQAKELDVEPYSQQSPHLRNCCLILSANESYQNTAEDLETLTGVKISKSSQQRMVHRQEFRLPIIEDTVEELSVDGGKVRIRTPLGEKSEWKDYKSVRLHNLASCAKFQDNQGLVDWVNEQSLDQCVICLGDGHDGIWNIIKDISEPDQRFEILDWYHLVENLHKVETTVEVLDKIEALLWQGDVSAAILELELLSGLAERFIKYLNKHRCRIPEYDVLKFSGFSIGSGAVESLVKQISHRIKISGAQWKKENVPQVLSHRIAYLNKSLVI